MDNGEIRQMVRADFYNRGDVIELLRMWHERDLSAQEFRCLLDDKFDRLVTEKIQFLSRKHEELGLAGWGV